MLGFTFSSSVLSSWIPSSILGPGIRFFAVDFKKNSEISLFGGLCLQTLLIEQVDRAMWASIKMPSKSAPELPANGLCW